MFPAWRRRRCALGWLRTMARIALIAVLAAAVLGTARPAGAWVFFYQTFSEWSVVCWRSHEGANDPRCSLSAPPDSHALGTRNVLHVQEYAPDAFQVAIEVRDKPMPGIPVFLRIGQKAPREAGVRDGFAAWTGNQAALILGEMLAADRVVFRIQTAPEGMPRDAIVSLQGFGQALEVYRREVRRYGLLDGAR